VFFSWIVALAALITSLVLSEVLVLTPCKLCWYQRIFLFSAVFVLGAAEYYKDKRAYRFVLPLTVTGGAIALYHTLLQWGVVPEGDLTCNIDAACATKHLNVFGFITIPFLSLLTFIVISLLMFVLRRQQLAQEEQL
jgi:disulfide bond formation protein DsbB